MTLTCSCGHFGWRPQYQERLALSAHISWRVIRHVGRDICINFISKQVWTVLPVREDVIFMLSRALVTVANLKSIMPIFCTIWWQGNIQIQWVNVIKLTSFLCFVLNHPQRTSQRYPLVMWSHHLQCRLPWGPVLHLGHKLHVFPHCSVPHKLVKSVWTVGKKENFIYQSF